MGTASLNEIIAPAGQWPTRLPLSERHHARRARIDIDMKSCHSRSGDYYEDASAVSEKQLPWKPTAARQQY